MTAKVKLIKKEHRNLAASQVTPVAASADPREWSTTVKLWVKEFQKDRPNESSEAFDRLFTEPTP